MKKIELTLDNIIERILLIKEGNPDLKAIIISKKKKNKYISILRERLYMVGVACSYGKKSKGDLMDAGKIDWDLVKNDSEIVNSYEIELDKMKIIY